jgi:hypothetical protein
MKDIAWFGGIRQLAGVWAAAWQRRLSPSSHEIVDETGS